ncbi:unnamed protein product [Ixodes pacificus]
MFVMFKSIEWQIASTLEARSPYGNMFWMPLTAVRFLG